jgi:hypothetical protein
MAPVGSGSGGACGCDCRRTDGEVTVRLRTIACDWEKDMAKGQKRSNREAKKLKAGKKKTVAATARCQMRSPNQNQARQRRPRARNRD